MRVKLEIPAAVLFRFARRGNVPGHIANAIGDAILASRIWGDEFRVDLDISEGAGLIPWLRDGNNRVAYLTSRDGGEILVPVTLVLPSPWSPALSAPAPGP